jgi:hypothetical protein
MKERPTDSLTAAQAAADLTVECLLPQGNVSSGESEPVLADGSPSRSLRSHTSKRLQRRIGACLAVSHSYSSPKHKTEASQLS